MTNFKKNAICLLIIFSTSCTFFGKNDQKKSGVVGFLTGSTKVDQVRDVHVVNLIRAIGAPNNVVSVDKFKYYQWQHTRVVGVSTLFGGGSTSLYCNLTAETKNNKIKSINWYGNRCDVFLDQIAGYFENKFNIVVISEEEEVKKVEKIEKSEKTEKPDVKSVTDLQNDDSKKKLSEQQIIPKVTDPTSVSSVGSVIADNNSNS